MLPYLEYHAIIAGPITLQVWGLWVSLGVIAGVLLADRLAKKNFLAPQLVWDLAVWALLAALVGARVGHVLFYDPSYYFANPVEMLYFWQGGASSLGGFIGAGLAVWAFAKIRKISFNQLSAYLDVMVPGLWLGWAIGRIGCFFIHDHPGTLSNFLLAVKFPDGARHDLGLYDSILAWALFALCLIFFKKLREQNSGQLFLFTIAIYAFARFWLDFLRATDVRYLYLTPAQWGMGVVFLGLTFWQIYGKIRSTPIK